MGTYDEADELRAASLAGSSTIGARNTATTISGIEIIHSQSQ